MLIDALHAALEDRIVALNRIGGDGGRFDVRLAIGADLVGNFVPIADVFLFAVVDGIVVGEVRADFRVDVGLIGHQASFAADVLPNDRGNLGNGRAVNMKATGIAAAFNQRKNGVLMG